MKLIEKRGSIEIWHSVRNDEYIVYGVTLGGDPRVVPSLSMAREVAGL